MGWKRQAPEGVAAPAPIVLGRWILAACVAVPASVLLFLLHVSARVPAWEAFNIWIVSGSPLLVWLLAFSARACLYGGALSHHQFLAEEAKRTQLAWEEWANRFLAVQASCVLLPDQVSARKLLDRSTHAPPRTATARRIEALPEKERAQRGLRWVLSAMEPALRALPVKQPLRVTLLSDVEPGQYEALRGAWQQLWITEMGLPPPEAFTLSAELSYQWIDETLRTASTAVELILVLQVHGEAAYSDALAALLLCPDRLAQAWELPMTGGLSRPMPLDISCLGSELPVFLKSQSCADRAIGLLADHADWQPLLSEVFVIGSAQGASLELNQQWIQERLWGPPGPFSHWLIAALGIEMTRHQERPLLMLTRENSRHWVSTLTTGEAA